MTNNVLNLDEVTKIAMEWEPTIDSCVETKDAFIFSYPKLRDSIGPQAIVVLKKDGKRMFYNEYLFNKEAYGLNPEDDVDIAEHTL